MKCRQCQQKDAEIERLLNVARGCHDYGGGHRERDAEVYHHGIQTVINALEAAREGNTLQTRVLEAIGLRSKSTTLSDIPLPTYCGCNELLENIEQLEAHVERGCWREA